MSYELENIEKLIEVCGPEDLRVLLSIKNKVERIQEENPLALYRPNEVTDLFHRSAAKERFVFGANMSGKTYAGFKDLGCELLEYDPSGTTGDRYYGKNPLFRDMPKVYWFGSVSIDKCIEMYEQDFRLMMPKGSIASHPNKNKLYAEMTNGNLLWLKSYDMAIEKWQSSRIDGAMLDEQPPWGHYKECRSRVNRKGGRIWCLMTPKYVNSAWTFREIFQKGKDNPDIEWWTMDLMHNIFLPKEYIDRQARAFQGTEDEESVLHGRFTILKGVIHSGFEEERHCIKFNPYRMSEHVKAGYRFARVVDGHPRSPNVAMWFAYKYDPAPAMILINEYDEPGGNVRHFAEKVFEIERRMGVVIEVTILDTPDVGDQESPDVGSLRYEFIDCGIVGIPAERGHAAGVQRFNEYLKNNRFRVSSECRKSINSIAYHMWQEYKGVIADEREPKEKYVHKDDHWVRNCHYMALFLPPLSGERFKIIQANKYDPGYEYNTYYNPVKNRHAR